MHVRNGAHIGEERVILRHITGRLANLANIGAGVEAENSRGSGGGLVEAEQGVDEGRFSGSVRAQQPDGAGGKRAPQIVEDAPPAEIDRQAVEFDNGAHCAECGRMAFSSTPGIWNGAPPPASASRLNPNRLPVEVSSMRSGPP